ncbi:hypothetical protein Sjap_008612 [Stephania japonica]|uniref:Uncharacterized protein n=1 Tax=Stephania japonica TaxID=461633 RepID=A0AAP0JRG2_9MAGN
MYDGIIKDLIFPNSSRNSLEARETKRRCVRTRYPKQQEEGGKGLNRRNPEHLVISDVPISMERVTHYLDFDESFLRTEEDYVNTYSKSHLSIPLWKNRPQFFFEELAMIYPIHA